MADPTTDGDEEASDRMTSSKLTMDKSALLQFNEQIDLEERELASTQPLAATKRAELAQLDAGVLQRSNRLKEKKFARQILLKDIEIEELKAENKELKRSHNKEIQEREELAHASYEIFQHYVNYDVCRPEMASSNHSLILIQLIDIERLSTANARLRAANDTLRAEALDFESDGSSTWKSNERVKAHVKEEGLREGKECLERYGPSYCVGRKVRNRYLAFHSGQPRDHSLIDAGNRAAHNGLAIADATLYCIAPEGELMRTDAATYSDLYGTEWSTTWKQLECQKFQSMVQWYGAVKSWCEDSGRTFHSTDFHKTWPLKLFSALENMEVDAAEAHLDIEDNKKVYENLQKLHTEELRKAESDLQKKSKASHLHGHTRLLQCRGLASGLL